VGPAQGLGAELSLPHAPQVTRRQEEAPTPAPPEKVLLIDSLGTWLAHHLSLDETAWCQRQDRLLTALDQQSSPVVLVCEEVGWGLVPPTAIGGLFRDRSGSLQQRLMQQAAAAWLVVQGRALNLMALGEPVPPG
jgi:adenosylcobinamide kinase/adenosylcobinamide-phosphate guanylyltransferase